jgi:hypothetical protein
MLAVTALRGGRPVVALIDSRSGDVKRELRLDGLDDASIRFSHLMGARWSSPAM